MKHGILPLLTVAVAVTAMAAGFACSHSPNYPAPMEKDLSSRQTRVPGEYLITLAEGADGKVIADLYGRFVIKGTKDLGRNVFLVTLAEDPGPEKMEELRRQDARIKAVQPNYIYRFNRPGNPP